MTHTAGTDSKLPPPGCLVKAVGGALVGGELAEVDGGVALVLERLHQHLQGVVGVRHHVRREARPRIALLERHLSSGTLLSVYQASSNRSGRSLSDGATTDESALSPASLSCPANRSSPGMSASM